MSPEQFCYWLQGKIEDRATLPDEAEWQSIKEHLQKVFTFVPVKDLKPYCAERPSRIRTRDYGGIVC